MPHHNKRKRNVSKLSTLGLNRSCVAALRVGFSSCRAVPTHALARDTATRARQKRGLALNMTRFRMPPGRPQPGVRFFFSCGAIYHSETRLPAPYLRRKIRTGKGVCVINSAEDMIQVKFELPPTRSKWDQEGSEYMLFNFMVVIYVSR